MSIKVRFDKHGFYSRIYGRMGRGKNQGRIYTLPDHYAETETIEVPIMDMSSRPARPTGEVKELSRFKYLPSTAEIIGDDYVRDLKAQLELSGGDEAAEIENEIKEIENAVRPKVVTPEAMEEMQKARESGSSTMGAQERTTGKKPARKRAAATE